MDLETRLDGQSKLCIQAEVVLILPDDTSFLPVSCQWGATRQLESCCLIDRDILQGFQYTITFKAVFVLVFPPTVECR